MPGFRLPGRVGSLRSKKSNQGKQLVADISWNEFDWKNADFDPQEFNPFDQPDMAITLDGRPTTTSNLDPYAMVDTPRQTLTQYLSSDLTRAKRMEGSSKDGPPLTKVHRGGSKSFQKISGYHVPRSQWNLSERCIAGTSHHRVQQQRRLDNLPTPAAPLSRPIAGKPLRALRTISEVSREREYDQSSHPTAHPRVQQLRKLDNLPSPASPQSRPIAGKPIRAFRRISEVSREGEDEETSHPTAYPPRVIRRITALPALREEQPRIVSPTFDKPGSTWRPSSPELWGTAQQILEPQVDQPGLISLDGCLQSQVQRRLSNKSPDSAISGVKTNSSKDLEEQPAGDEDPQPSQAQGIPQESHSAEADQALLENLDRGRPGVRIGRSQSCRQKEKNPWLDSSDGGRGRAHFKHSLDETRTRATTRNRAASNECFTRKYMNDIAREIEHGGWLNTIYKTQENIRETILDGHLDRILNTLRRQPAPQTTGDLGNETLEDIQREIPVAIHHIHALRYVSPVQWTPQTEATMSSGLVAATEDAQDPACPADVLIPREHKKKWWTWRKKDAVIPEDDEKINHRRKSRFEMWRERRRLNRLVYDCSIGKESLDKCRERRLKRQRGVYSKKIC
ncbi:hypothetical protein EG329_001266 [Mollisiaceae sp. DMI_Dod_QoI]|nr:hypothetical protein EG329_001266 [Helotiales sp. DMI_Dod_QoI]